MLEAGATDVYPSYRGAPIVRRRADLATVQATFAVGRASVMTVHLCSTVPLGESDDAPADSHGRLRRPPTSASTTPRCCPTRRASTRRRR